MKTCLIAHNYTRTFYFLLLLISAFSVSSCLSVKPSTTKSGKKYFETFYVGAAGTQYFIKPLLFQNTTPAEDLLLDITFRYRDEVKDSAIINFSIKSPIIYKTIDSLRLTTENRSITRSRFELLFNEKNKSGFTSRYSTRVSLQELKSLFDASVWNVFIYNKGQTNSYLAPQKTNKALQVVKDKVFVLM